MGPRPDGTGATRGGAVVAGCLHRRGQERRLLPRPRRRGLPSRLRGARRTGRLLRAFRRQARRDHVPLPVGAPVPGGTARMSTQVVDVARGLWVWRTRHPAWSPTADWDELVTSTCVESGGEVALLDPLAPPEDAHEVWARLDARPPTMLVILKPDHVRDVDVLARRYGARAFG